MPTPYTDFIADMYTAMTTQPRIPGKKGPYEPEEAQKDLTEYFDSYPQYVTRTVHAENDLAIIDEKIRTNGYDKLRDGQTDKANALQARADALSEAVMSTVLVNRMAAKYGIESPLPDTTAYETDPYVAEAVAGFAGYYTNEVFENRHSEAKMQQMLDLNDLKTQRAELDIAKKSMPRNGYPHHDVFDDPKIASMMKQAEMNDLIPETPDTTQEKEDEWQNY